MAPLPFVLPFVFGLLVEGRELGADVGVGVPVRDEGRAIRLVLR